MAAGTGITVMTAWWSQMGRVDTNHNKVTRVQKQHACANPCLGLVGIALTAAVQGPRRGGRKDL